MKRISTIFCMVLMTGAAFAQNPAAPTVAPKVPAAPEKTESLVQQTPPPTAVSLEEQFKGQLPFALTEEKMIAFTEATLRVKRINDKWDVQIAGAETDQRAIEYNNFAVEEITTTLKKIPGLTLEQYTAMTKLTASNPDFSRIYSAYKDLLQQGKIKPPVEAKPDVATPKEPTVQSPAKPQVPAVMPAVPANSGTAPAPRD